VTTIRTKISDVTCFFVGYTFQNATAIRAHPPKADWSSVGHTFQNVTTIREPKQTIQINKVGHTFQNVTTIRVPTPIENYLHF
jgi:hypothetical protein